MTFVGIGQGQAQIFLIDYGHAPTHPSSSGRCSLAHCAAWPQPRAVLLLRGRLHRLPILAGQGTQRMQLRAPCLRFDDQPCTPAVDAAQGSYSAEADHFSGTSLWRSTSTAATGEPALYGTAANSSAVQAECYLLACQRYIELNPGRAAIVDDPVHYRWSSYRSYAA